MIYSLFVRNQVKIRAIRWSDGLLMVLFFLWAGIAFGQNKDLEKANELYRAARYAEAAGMYEKVLESYAGKKRSSRSSLNVKTKLARCYGMNNRYTEAEKLYAEIVRDERAAPEAFLRYGETLMANGKYDQSKEFLLKYKALKPEDKTVELLIRSCEVAPYIPPYFENVGVKPFPYNSEADDNSPIIWKGGVLFSSDRKSGVKLLKEKSGWTGRDFLDLYFSEALEDGSYAPPVQFSGKLSVLNKNLCNASISRDGSLIYFTRNDNEPNKREIYNLQLYVAKAAGEKWKDVEKLPFCSANSNYMHPAISPDGNTLFFTSDKPGGRGGTDLWMTRKKNGAWKRPENLGEVINTPLNEGFPFVSADGSLFFCSKGHPGLGGFDIFMTRQKPDGTWQKPVNLGRPINSSFDDISIFLNADGRSGMFTSARDGGDDDIYFFSPKFVNQELAQKETAQPLEEQSLQHGGAFSELPSEKQEVPTVEPVEIPNGQNAQAEKPQNTQAAGLPKEMKEEYEDPFSAPSKEPVNNGVGQVKQGDTLAASEMMPPPEKEEVPALGLLAFQELERKLNLNTLKPGDRFRLDGARYDVNVWQPTPQVAAALDQLAALMKKNPTFVIELGAHTESIGLDTYNLELSKNRANLAREYLLREGITPDRVVAKGYGETELLNHCANGVDCSLMEHLVNQRLEIKILKL